MARTVLWPGDGPNDVAGAADHGFGILPRQLCLRSIFLIIGSFPVVCVVEQVTLPLEGGESARQQLHLIFQDPEVLIWTKFKLNLIVNQWLPPTARAFALVWLRKVTLWGGARVEAKIALTVPLPPSLPTCHQNPPQDVYKEWGICLREGHIFSRLIQNQGPPQKIMSTQIPRDI